MALWIKADGTESEIIGEEKDGSLTLEQMQKAVGGYVETITLPKGIMVLNEEGKLQGLPINEKATRLAMRFIGPSDLIVGDVLFCSRKEIK